MNFREYLKENIVLFDGAMGTQIQHEGLKIGELPESYNLLKPQTIEKIHQTFVDAGSHVVSTNTFGASAYKLGKTLECKEVIEEGVKLAKKSGAFVALDIGPIGKMMAPIGEMTFDEAYESFKQQFVNAGDADLILIETMSDLNELRAAVLAAKENTDLPIVVSMTFEATGRTLTGVTPEAYVYTMEGLGVDGLGVNCSLGPDLLLPIIKRLINIASVPVIVQANAGLPQVVNGQTVYDISPEAYAKYVQEMIDLGVRMIGGCCGTTPAHIKAITPLIEGSQLTLSERSPKYQVCSKSQVVDFNKFVMIGERINPTGHKKLKADLKALDINSSIKEGIEQSTAGAHILDINVGLPDFPESDIMCSIVDVLSQYDTPLQIDSTDSIVIENAIRRYPGIAVINSVNGDQESMDSIFPIAKKYGAFIICLTLDDHGIPNTSEKRLEIAKRIITEAATYGISKERLIMDSLILTVSSEQLAVKETLKTIETMTNDLNVLTTLGISNVSYGMPNRKLITRTFLSLAISSGLTSAIMDPLDSALIDALRTTQLLLGDCDTEVYIDHVKSVDELQAITPNDLYNNVLKGYKTALKEWTRDQLKQMTALELINNHLIPTLDEIGLNYEKGVLYLPQLVRAADTISAAFDLIKSTLKNNESFVRGCVVLGTVKGDVHDIGKNLVKVLLESYGFKVVDLGKNVDEKVFSDAVIKHNAKLVGLSALMTTTATNMASTIAHLKLIIPDVKVFVGGAVITAEYAEKINADFYCKDAKASVDVAKDFFD